MDLIYQCPKSAAKIYQTSYREIPHDLAAANIQLAVFTASECPPLNHHVGATLSYQPNEDKQADSSSPTYKKMLESAQKASNVVAEAVTQGKNVVITCHQGINRSSLVTALAIKRISNLTAWEIINLLKAKRQGVLTNSSFMTMILTS